MWNPISNGFIFCNFVGKIKNEWILYFHLFVWIIQKMKFKVSENPNVLNKTKYIKKKKTNRNEKFEGPSWGDNWGFSFWYQNLWKSKFQQKFFSFFEKNMIINENLHKFKKFLFLILFKNKIYKNHCFLFRHN